MTDQPSGSSVTPMEHIVKFAVEVSTWSPCRSKRGAVVFIGENIIGHGHNYKPRQFACDGSAACKATCRDEAVHAEQEALLSLGRRAEGMDLLHVKTVDGALVPSGGPSCVQCSKLALVAGIASVWLFHESGWRRYDAVEFHQLSLEAALALRREAETPHREFAARLLNIVLGDLEWVRAQGGRHSVCPLCHAVCERDGGPGHTDECERIAIAREYGRLYPPDAVGASRRSPAESSPAE